MNNVLPSIDLLNKEVFDDQKYYNLSELLKDNFEHKMLIPIGIDQRKTKYYVDLKDTSGIFIGGATGSGKSMFLDALIITLLLKNTPENLKFLMINPCEVELKDYEYLPHQLTKVKVNSEESLKSLENILNIMEQRRNLLRSNENTNIESFNEKHTEKLPHILIIIDESENLMEEEKTKEILEKILCDGRSLGVHLILATSSYFKKDFDKNFMKLFSYVLSFDLSSQEQAEFIDLKDSNLLAVSGEALIKNHGQISKIQTPFISDEEIKKVVSFITNQNKEKNNL